MHVTTKRTQARADDGIARPPRKIAAAVADADAKSISRSRSKEAKVAPAAQIGAQTRASADGARFFHWTDHLRKTSMVFSYDVNEQSYLRIDSLIQQSLPDSFARQSCSLSAPMPREDCDDGLVPARFAHAKIQLPRSVTLGHLIDGRLLLYLEPYSEQDRIAYALVAGKNAAAEDLAADSAAGSTVDPDINAGYFCTQDLQASISDEKENERISHWLKGGRRSCVACPPLNPHPGAGASRVPVPL